MPHVITRTCQGTCNTACATVCPVDCIHGPIPLAQLPAATPLERARDHPTLQLFIDPEECIDCGGCVEVCPVDAIYPDYAVPEPLREDIARNAEFFAERDAT